MQTDDEGAGRLANLAAEIALESARAAEAQAAVDKAERRRDRVRPPAVRYVCWKALRSNFDLGSDD